MKERLDRKIDRTLRKILFFPRRPDDVIENFKHADGCSKVFPLSTVKTENEVYQSFGGGWVGGGMYVTVIRNFLQCDECHIKEEFF